MLCYRVENKDYVMLSCKVSCRPQAVSLSAQSSRAKRIANVCLHNSCSGGTGGDSPLYGLNGDVRPNRAWVSEGLVLNRVSISSIFAINWISLHDLMYSLTG